MILFKKAPNSDAVIVSLLKNLRVKIDDDDVSAELERHPDYPGLLAISDVLTAFKIENSAYRVEPGQVQNVPCPFIANTNLNHGDFVVVNYISGDDVSVSSEKWNNRKITLNSFKTMFAGVVLTVDAMPKSFAKPIALKKFKTPFIISVIGLMLLSALVFNAGYFASLSWEIVFSAS